MKTRFYMLGLLLAVSAFMTAFVITAQQDDGAATKPAVPAVSNAPAPAAAAKAPAKADDGLTPARPAKAAAPADGLPTAGQPPPKADLPATDGLTEPKKEEGEGFVEVTSDKGEVRGAKVAASQNAGKINLTLDDVEMIDVARMFTKISDANILYNPTNLHGRVTVNFTDVEWKPALESILGMHQLALVESPPGSSVFTISPKVAGPEPQKVETFFLKYATVAEVQGLLAPVVGAGGTIAPFPSRNALVIRATVATLGEVKQIIERVDKLRDQVFIEAKFMELSDQATRDLGIDWQVLQSYKVGAGNLQWGLTENRTWANTRTDTARQFDNRSNVDTLNNNYDIDGQPYQVSTSTDRESPPGSGHYVTDSTITPTRTITDTINRGKNNESQSSESYNKNVTDIRTAVLGAADFNLLLSALKTMNGVSIISNPKILVANEQAATIHIGQRERPFVATVTPATQMSAPIVTYNPGEPVEFGVLLKVTPTVNTASNITVKIDPELTSFVRNDVAPNGQTYPIISTKKITTTFCLESGKTVAIGGLIGSEDREVETKIPLSGDIPIIGKYLFSHSSTQKKQDETVIFVTVGLAIPESIAAEDGYPQNTQLARQQVLVNEVNRAKFNKDMEDLKKAGEEKKESGETAPSRLLKRRL